ncbi:CAP-Gly domain-containing linker protein 1-like isoform X4 [Mya arenaria]|uniref:CAP-Gly domain-containing linker protein 1-like isoform X4 n=1 Tax=Mya arenaria TaxID=6604 RepID=UPI0022E523CB|nr:CAP-Gly domain-containing linker protein 1-like isoform X4 [Mya arenaria]
MSLPKPTGMKTPGSKLARPSTGIPQKSGLAQPGSLSRAQSPALSMRKDAIAKSARAAGINSSLADKYAANAAHAFAGEEELNAPPPPPDDFIIGDRVFVSGSKPGFIAFLGETQFAPGDWAGVVLDETIGKNDGSVSGVKYFQCEAKRGVFCRISKLSRTPGIVGGQRYSEDATSEVSVPVNGNGASGLRRPTTPSLQQRPTTPSHGRESGIARPTTPSLPRPIHKSLSSSSASLDKGHAPTKVKSGPVTSTPMASHGIKTNLKLGDRVLVSGSKLGTLRYLGPTDFAKGDWAGVELDDPVGKNDGAVAGKRYFDCRPRYGLFAPIHKVMKTSVPSTPGPSSMSRSMGSTGLRRERSGSQESVSSMSSATSSASRPRVRLGVSGLGNSQQPTTGGRSGQRPGSLNISTTTALQKALKEKEEHIEQLLRERDLERSDVARAAAQVDEAQNQLTQIQVEKERLLEENEEGMVQLRARMQQLVQDKRDLEMKLDDEKRKVEDLQFRIEEEVISKDDLESRTEEEEAKTRDLEKNLKKEQERAEKLETELISLRMMKEHHEKEVQSLEETQTSYLDQIEELTHKLSQAEAKLRDHDESRLEEGAKTSQVGLELEEKSNRVSELEDFLALKNKEVRQLQDKLAEMKDEFESKSAKFDKLQQNFDELNEKVKSMDVGNNDLNTQLQNLKSLNAETQRQLASSEERSNQLLEEKKQLDLQVTEMMKNSGDSSHQLSMLNEQLGQKNRKIEDLQADLSTSTQKWHSLNDKLESSMREKDREIEMLNNKHEGIRSQLTSDMDDIKKELEKSKAKLISMEQDFASEKSDLVRRKDGEITELKQQLEATSENASQQEIQTQAHKQVLDKITLEKEALQFERDKLEKQLKRVEGERDTASGELITARVEASRTQATVEEYLQGRRQLDDQIVDLQDEKQQLEKNLAEVQKQRDDLQEGKEKACTERDQLQRDTMEHRAAIQQRDILVEELQKELEKLRTTTNQQQETITSLMQQTSDSGDLHARMAEQTSQIDGLRKQLGEKETAIKDLQKATSTQKDEMRTMKIELEESQEAVSLLEDSVQDLEKERDNLTSQLQGAFENRREQDKVLELNQKLNEEIESIKNKHRGEVESLKSQHTSLQADIDSSTTLIQQKDLHIQQQLKQITEMEKGNSMLTTYKTSNEMLEKEIAGLKDQVNQLQTKLSESHNNANIVNNVGAVTSEGTNALVEKLREENGNAQGQVEFLNSVIVDLQQKNEELKVRLEVMENGVTNGQDSSMAAQTPTKRAAPRMFCDICDVFDQHETEDCPQQEMSDSPPPSKHHGDRHQIRPYCDICEEFHPPCPLLSKDKVLATGAERIDPKALVEDWVKTVDSISTELAQESEKVFGNDGEFFPVLADSMSNSAGFRDSGYYDGVLESKISLSDPISSRGKVLSDFETEQIIETVDKKHKAMLRKGVRKTKTNIEEQGKLTLEINDDSTVFRRPGSLPPLHLVGDRNTNNASSKGVSNTPASATSPSDSEYQSGQESLGSSSESPVGGGTPEMESSVDTGEVFQADTPTHNDPRGETDGDKPAENCVIS